MGQKHSKEIADPVEEKPKITKKRASKRNKSKRDNSNKIDLQTLSGTESCRNIDSYLHQMGIRSVVEPIDEEDESSDSEEITYQKDCTDLREKVQHLYDMRMHRYKQRLSAMYPERSRNGTVNITRFRTDTMSELVSYLDTAMQIRLKSVSHYFRKLITISHYDVSLTTHSGWVDVIHLSSFLKRIRLYGEPKERDLRVFTKMIENDNFTELSCLEFHHIGEWALLEIIESICQHIQRAISLGILDNLYTIELTIQETDFTPFFASKFAKCINMTLHHILSKLHLILIASEGIEVFLKEVYLSACSHLVVLDLSNIPLLRHGFDLLVKSLWISHDDRNEIPRLVTLNLSNTGLHDSVIPVLDDIATSGYLSSLTTLDISKNSLTTIAFDIISTILSNYLIPNLHIFNCNDNSDMGYGFAAPFFIQLQAGVCPLIEVIHCNHCNLNCTDIDAIGLFLLSPYAENVKVLDIGNNSGIYDSLSQFFQCLSNCTSKHLEVLNLEGNCLGKANLSDLKSYLLTSNLNQLNYLYLNNNHIDQECARVILDCLTKVPTLELSTLDLSSNLIGSFNTKHWEYLIYNHSLNYHGNLIIHQFDISHNPLSNDDFVWLVKYLETYVSIPLLSEAKFEDSNVSARGISAFFHSFPKQLTCNLTKLSVVSLSIRCIGSELNHWLCSPAASNLKKLVLLNCNLCKMDLTYLINAFEISSYCSHLQTLRLSGNYEIEDDFVKDFVRIYSIEGILPYLYEFDISYTKVTKIGAYALLDFFKTHTSYSIRRLNLAYTKLSENRINILFEEYKNNFKGGCMF